MHQLLGCIAHFILPHTHFFITNKTITVTLQFGICIIIINLKNYQ